MAIPILYLSYDGMTDPLGQSQVLPYLAGLTAKGYQFTLISFEKEERYHANRHIIDQICDQHQIDWQPLMYTKKPPVLSTIKDIRAMRHKAAALHRQKKFSFIHCRSYIAALTGLWMKKKLGTPFLFDMRGFWADERVDGGLWNLKNPVYKTVYRYFKKKEKEFLMEAAHTISLTHNAATEIHSWQGMQDVPIQVIPCCVDLEHFNGESTDGESIHAKKSELGIDGHRVLSYIGSLGTWYMLDEMLDFFKEWSEEDDRLLFLFVTPDDASGILNSAQQKNIPAEKIIIKKAQRKDMPLYIAVSDVQVFFIKPAYSKKASSPTKQGEIMAMGKPVVCNAGVGDTDYVVNQYGSGILVKRFSDKDYQEAINQLNEIRFDPAAIQAGAADFFSLEEGVQCYADVYKKILS